ncbi:MAG TPA: D-alanine--D-alanine ligase [Acetobacteraceae bacterium]|nr:D-alanine--D-alanine ligase [Acetobacteraceae bacterium]
MPPSASGETALATLRNGREPDPAVSFFEFWPGWLFYTPVVLHCAWMGLRTLSPVALTAANPRITAGGLCGESKTEILDQIVGPARTLVAPYTVLRAPASYEEAEAAIGRAGIAYPLVAKPDIGCNGTGVRLIRGAADLGRYLRAFPPGEKLILQELIPHRLEAGLFYVRHPDWRQGRITSLTLKETPFVVGNGRASLRELILADRRAGRVAHLYLPRLAGRLESVPPQGERVPLVFVGNHCKGAVFRNGADHITPALTEAIESFARAIPDFHFGRIDVRFDSLAELRRGRGFRVIEVNGAGSEATHIWDPRTRLRDAWKAQFLHYGLAYRIGAANRKRGARATRIGELLRLWRNQRRLLASYPTND